MSVPFDVLFTWVSMSAHCVAGQVDPEGLVIQANPRLRRQLGCEGQANADEGKRFESILPPEAIPRWRDLLTRLRSAGSHELIDLPFEPRGTPFRCVVYREADGSVWLLGEPAGDDEAGETLGVLASRLAEAQAQAHSDPLTGLANRRQADIWLAEAARVARSGQRPTACLLFDLDRLKNVNDAFGHAAGDQALQAVARSLVAGLRSTDRLARYGGDEFLVLAHDLDLPGARGLAERLQTRLAGLRVPPEGPPLTACFGLTLSQPGDSALALRDRADRALLLAKRQGRNRIETA